MKFSFLIRAAWFAAALGMAWEAQASSAASSASDSLATSSGSVSDSLNGSSNSSNDRRRVADGDYQIIQIAQTPGHADRVRLTMQADDPQQRVVLDLPQATFDQQRLAGGDVVYAKNRVYGIEFGRGDTHQPFYLVLADDWHDELANRPVTL